MRFQPIEGGEVETLRDCAPLGVVGDEIDPFAVAHLVEAELAGEAIGHPILPCSRSASGVASSCRAKLRSAPALRRSLASSTSPLYRLWRAASTQSSSAPRPSATRRAS